MRPERVYRECASESAPARVYPARGRPERVRSERVHPARVCPARVCPARVCPESVQREVQAPREGTSSESAPRESFLESMSTHLKQP